MYDSILVPTDGSQTAELATEKAIEITSRYGSQLHGMYVVEETRENPDVKGRREKVGEEVNRADQVLTEFDERARTQGIDAETVREEGTPRTAIEDYVENRDIDLVIIGSVGASGVAEKLLGTVAKYVVNEAPADVLVVRPDERTA